MDYFKVSVEEVEEANKEPTLKEGYYPAVMSVIECGYTKGGMPKLSVDLRPLAEEGNRASGVRRFQHQKHINVPVLTDAEVYLNYLHERLQSDEVFADKHAGKEGDELIASALKSHRSFALNAKGDLINVARIILGTDVVPKIPEYNFDRKSYVDEDGSVFTKDEVKSATNAIGAQACEIMAKEITDGAVTGIFDCVIFKPAKKKEYSILSHLPTGKQFSEIQ